MKKRTKRILKEENRPRQMPDKIKTTRRKRSSIAIEELPRAYTTRQYESYDYDENVYKSDRFS